MGNLFVGNEKLVNSIKTGNQFVYIEKIVRKIESVTIIWTGRNIYSDALLCIKNSYTSFEDFINILSTIDISNETYQDNNLLIKKIKINDRTVDIPRKLIKIPSDMIILPVNNNDIFVPNKEDYQFYLKTLKVELRYQLIRKKAGFLGLGKNIINYINIFDNDTNIPDDETILYYQIDGIRYPISRRMFSKSIKVFTPKNSHIKIDLSEKFKKYISLREER